MIISSFSIAQNATSSVIMLDKMNVLYLGIDNPISISSPQDFNNTTVAITNGTIIGSGAHRIVKPEQIGTTSITITTTNGLNASYQYRVKRIPDPIFKVGSGSGIINIAEFMVQKVCRAEIENFDFDFKYIIKNADVSFSGKGFEDTITCKISGNSLSPLSKYLPQCEPGTIVTFENITVSGPDGERKIEGKSYTLF